MGRREQVQTIGRFEIRSLLGEGAQSAVFLAWDPHLERDVAIKRLHFSDAVPESGASLLREARAVANLRHPNIVPIFEAGEKHGEPYLVFEYVEGPTLAQLLAQQGALPEARAVEIVCGVLGAIGEAHRHGVLHRDLKPSNILIDGAGEPRVMDFGIATRVADAPRRGASLSGAQSCLSGTPSYMAPEYIESRRYTVRSDLFAVGLILYELVSGERAVAGGSPLVTMQNIASGRFCLSTQGAVPLDERLRAIVSRATALDPALRFDSAEQMSHCLQAYLQPEAESPGAASGNASGNAAGGPGRGKGVLDFLLRRMQHKGDFPALSESIRAINRLTASDRESVNTLSNTIVKDFALTNRILRLVNGPCYRPAGAGSISTVSRAIVVLGFNTIRDIAISLILVEHVQNQANAAVLKEEFLRASFSGAIAREIAGRLALRDTEEAYICAMMRNLGRFLAQYYLTDEADEVRRLVAGSRMTEESASIRVLGMSYQELGIGVARAWGFPDAFVNGLRHLGAGPLRPAKSRDDVLRTIAGFANEVCAALEAPEGQDLDRQIEQVRKRYAAAMAVSEKQLRSAIQYALKETADFCASARLSIKESQLGKLLKRGIGSGESADATSTQPPGGAELSLPGTLFEPALVAGARSESVAQASSTATAEAEPGAAAAVLAAGIQDISNSLVEEFSLNDLLRMILETIYRAMGFDHVLLCVRDARTDRMMARFGFGPRIANAIKRFRFDIADSGNIFSVALARGADMLISDANDPKIAERLPGWHRESLGAKTFAVFPLVLRNQPVAMIYVDSPNAGDIVISEQELGLLRTLRNQAVLAIKQGSK